jgi:5-formyltetrahydrofolate cyclo-ligase
MSSRLERDLLRLPGLRHSPAKKTSLSCLVQNDRFFNNNQKQLSTKQEFRKLYLQKRMDLSPDAYALSNNDLLIQFQQINFDHIKCISLFLPMLERREPDTFLMIDWLKQNHPSIKLAFPKANFATSSMQHFLDDAALEIDSNDFGVPEPIAGNVIDVKEIDMVIVPLLAFDEQGYRVGYGKGFYDRFMAECKVGALFTGLSFFGPVDAIDDVNEYDMPLHQCITPEKLWVFNK